MLRQTGDRREPGDTAWTPIAAYLTILPIRPQRTQRSLVMAGRRLNSAKMRPSASRRPARSGRTSAACRCAPITIGPACSMIAIFPRSKTSIRKTCPILGPTASCSILPAGSKTRRSSFLAQSWGWSAAPMAKLPCCPMCPRARCCHGLPIIICRSWPTRRRSASKPNSSISANRPFCTAGSCCRFQAMMTRLISSTASSTGRSWLTSKPPTR